MTPSSPVTSLTRALFVRLFSPTPVPRADVLCPWLAPEVDLHMAYFMVPLSVIGLGLPWKLLWVTAGVNEVVWKVRKYPRRLLVM